MIKGSCSSDAGRVISDGLTLVLSVESFNLSLRSYYIQSTPMISALRHALSNLSGKRRQSSFRAFDS
jgi:hypothetical protein